MKLVFFDLETTGVNPGKNGIHQISGQIVIDGVVKESFDFHVQPNPKAIIEDEALKVAGVTREQVMAYPPMREVYNQFVGMLAKYVTSTTRKTSSFWSVTTMQLSTTNFCVDSSCRMATITLVRGFGRTPLT